MDDDRERRALAINPGARMVTMTGERVGGFRNVVDDSMLRPLPSHALIFGSVHVTRRAPSNIII